MKQKNGLLLFISTCIPGCGQMYQGYMKRGLSLLMAFCGIFFVAAFMELGELAVLMLPVWLYAFFDSYNLRARHLDGTAEPDAYLFGLSDMDSQRFSALMRKRHSLIGWALVVLGGYLLYNSLLDNFFRNFDSWLYSALRYDLPRLFMTVLIILLGLWFIRGPKKAPPAEDIPAFTPPVQEAPPAAEQAGPVSVEAVHEEEDPHGNP